MKTFVKVLLFIFAISIITFFLYNSELIYSLRGGDYDTISSFVGENIFYLFLLTLAIMVIQNTLTIIPLFLVITLNNTLFGYFIGFIWSWLTSIIAAVLVFIGIRYGFKGKVMEKVNPKLFNKLEQKGIFVLIQVRIFPFVPSNIVNTVAGLSTIQFKQFLLGTAIGNASYFFALSLVQKGFLSGIWNEYLLVLIVLLSIVSYYLFKMLYRRKCNKLRSL